ncbi:ubiquitin carboxyl-terminal hydrolase 50 [Gastrophryne carolinensis]
MDVIVASLTSAQWASEDYAISKVVSSFCGLCSRSFMLKVKPERTKPIKLTYEGQSSKQDIFTQVIYREVLSEIVKKCNKNIRRQRTKKVEEKDMLQWVGRLLWSGLVGFDERPTKESLDISMRRYLSWFPDEQIQDMFTMFSTMPYRNIPTLLQEMNALQEKLALMCRTIFEPGQTLCVEKYKVELSHHQAVDLRVALLVDSDTGYICNFLIYSISQVLKESEQIPFLYIIRKLINPFQRKNYILQIDSSALINDTMIREFKKFGIQLAYSSHDEKKTLGESLSVSGWEGYAVLPLNGRDDPSYMFFIYCWLLLHISCINSFILESFGNMESKADMSLEDFVELLSRELTGAGAYLESVQSYGTDNTSMDQQQHNCTEHCGAFSGSSRDSGKNDPVMPMKEKSVTGLRNLGNTCYMNAVLQCLSSTSPLAEYFFSWQFAKFIASNERKFVNTLAHLLSELWFGKDQFVEPEDFWISICKVHPPFERQCQHDAQELLIYTLDALHEDLKRSVIKDSPDLLGDVDDNSTRRKALKSPISRMFHGVLRQYTMCLKCMRTSYKDDIFTVLSLPIPPGNEVYLEECLQCFFKQVTLTWMDRIFCYYCKAKQDASLEMQIIKPPKVLILHLKRFEYQGQVKQKLKTNVIFPLHNLDLSPFVASCSVRHLKYNLYSVVNHAGELEFGHYTSYCKHPETKEWHDFDDIKHFKIAESSVQSPLAYILFYTAK